MGLQNPSKPRQAIWFRCVTNIAQISFSKELVCGRCATSVTFQTSVTFRTQDLRKAIPLISFASTHHKRRAKPDRGDVQCSRQVSRVLVAQNAEKRCHCGSSSLKDPVSTRRLSNARNAMTPKPWWRRYPRHQMSPWQIRHQRRYRRLDRQDRFVLHATCAAATGYEDIKFGSVLPSPRKSVSIKERINLGGVQSPARSRYPMPVSVSTNCGRSGSASIFCRSWRT